MTDIPSAQSNEPCKALPWDSDFFGVNIARVEGHKLDRHNLDEINSWCGAREVGCLYFLADPNDQPTLDLCSQDGFQLVDIRTTYQFQDTLIPHARGSVNDLDVSEYGERDLEAIEAITRSSFTDSRFYFDPRFPDERCAELYLKWLHRDLSSTGTQTIVARKAGEPIGFLTCATEIEGGSGRISLIAVSADHRGHGSGRAMVRAALKWFNQLDIEPVLVTTQGRNLHSQRLYISEGFNLLDLKLWFHKWYTDPRPGAGAN